MADPAEHHAALGTAETASHQIEHAVRFICKQNRVSRISIIAHSWGTIATGRFAGRCSDLVDRLVIPSGPWQDIADAWAADLAYDPALIKAPLAIIRGEWDSLVTDADARWLFDSLTASPMRRDVKIAQATHLMHLEENRYALYRETEAFLRGNDHPEKQTAA